MIPKPVAIIPNEEQEEMYFLLIPVSMYRQVLEVAAKDNLSVQQLIQKGLEYVIKG